MDAYQRLEDHFEELSRLGEVISVLRWDDAVMMPPGGAEARAEQLALLKRMHHERLVDPRVADWLDAAADEELDGWQQANLREMRRRRIHAASVPAELVERFSRVSSKCESVWRTARSDDDFERVTPHLRRVVKLKRQIAAAKAEALGVEPYHALLDLFEPGMSPERIDEIFDEVARFLPELIEEVLQNQARQQQPKPLDGPFRVERQQKLARRMMEELGFDFDYGRLDTSHHPFCGGVPDDVRLTTHYDEDDVLRGQMAVLHETGHALYNLGLPSQWRNQPVGMPRSAGVHESQSLFVEMQLGRSRAFSRWSAPLYQEILDKSGDAWSADNLYRLKTRVRRSLIRVDADEVTYPAHVILRYRLERAMIEDRLQIEELPAAWAEGMEELVGIVPDDDRDGCMQDIHWMSGLFGYFPTYTLGAMMAAQLFEAAREKFGEVDEMVEVGEFAPLIDWLGETIHSKGCRLQTDELLEEATGSVLDPEYFRRHLKRRYLDA